MSDESIPEGHFTDLGHLWVEAAVSASTRVPCRRCGVDYLFWDGWQPCLGIRPRYTSGGFAVYSVGTDFHVMRNGGGGEPYRTTDFDLAREICGRWATEFTDAEGR